MRALYDFNKLPLAAQWTILMFALTGLSAAVFTILSQPVFAPSHVLLLLPITLVTARLKVKLYRGSTISCLTSAVLLAVISEGLAAALILGVCGVAIQTLLPSKKVVLHQLMFNIGMIAVTVSATWWTYRLLLGGQATGTLSAETAATVLASFTYFLGNSISVSLIVSLTKGLSLFHTWFHHFLYSAPSFLIGGFLSLGLVALAGHYTIPVMFAAVIVISIGYYCSVRLTAQVNQVRNA